MSVGFIISFYNEDAIVKRSIESTYKKDDCIPICGSALEFEKHLENYNVHSFLILAADNEALIIAVHSSGQFSCKQSEALMVNNKKIST